MKLKGILLWFIWCSDSQQTEFNYWYDTDHLPENRALPGIFHAQRYFAPIEHIKTREIVDIEGGDGNYLTVYFTENDPLQTEQDMISLYNRLRDENRFIRAGRVLFGGPFLVETVHTRPGFKLAIGAIPVIPHTGAYIVLDEVTEIANKQRLVEWYNEVYVPDILELPGFVAIFRFWCLAAGHENKVLHFCFLDNDALVAAQAMRQRISYWQRQGYMSDFQGIAHRIFAGPYKTLVTSQFHENAFK